MNATYTHTHTHTDTPTDTPTDTHRGRTTLVAHLGRGGYRRNRFDRSSTSDGAPLPTATEPRIPSDPLPKKKQQQTKTTRPGFTEFLQVLLGLTCFYRTSLGVTWLNLILTVFYRVLPSSTGFLPSFTGFNLFLPDFPRFHLVKPGFIEFLPSFRKSVFHLVTRFRLSVLREWDPFWTRRHFDEEMAVGFRFSFFFTLAHWSARAEETTCFVSLPRRP